MPGASIARDVVLPARDGTDRGRPRQFAGRIGVHLTEDQMVFVESEADRTDRPFSRVLRELVSEAIAARQRRAGARG
jgi:hypothetical protein